MTAVVVLFDDERSFKPGYRDAALVVRTVEAAKALFPTLPVIDELWLDYVLSPGATTEALHALRGVEVKRVIFHSSAWMARSMVVEDLLKYGVTAEVESPPMPTVFLPLR